MRLVLIPQSYHIIRLEYESMNHKKMSVLYLYTGNELIQEIDLKKTLM